MTEEAQPVNAVVVDQKPGAVTAVDIGEMSVKQLVARVRKIKEVMAELFEEGVHFGVVPGTERKDKAGNDISKRSLYKPGAELFCLTFGLDPRPEDIAIERDGVHITVDVTCVIYHISTGRRLGMARGRCSTREAKYAWRNSARLCPECGKPAIIKGKAEYGGGWVCFKRKDGCGAKFDDAAPEIVDQPEGKVENPDIADTENTVVQMAIKRAMVAGVRIVSGASGFFDQRDDLGMEEGGGEQTDEGAAPPKPAPKRDMRPSARSAQSPAGAKETIEKGAAEFVHAEVLAVENRTNESTGKVHYGIGLKSINEDAADTRGTFEAITFSTTDADLARSLAGKEVSAEVQDCRQGDKKWTKLISIGAMEPARDRSDIPF